MEPASSHRTALTVAGVALVALVLWGGYGNHWRWTGIDGHTATLWDWFQLLLLPMTVAVLPIWLSREARLDHRVKLGAALGGVALMPIVLAGYMVPWRWTGFPGNTLWDWLNLVALPLAVAMIPLWPELRREWRVRHTVILVVGGALVAVLVLGGYLAGWRWTGFTGNTLWNWLHLLLLPLLLPTVIVPALRPLAGSRMVPVTPSPGLVPRAGPPPSGPQPPPAASPETGLPVKSA